MNDTSPDPTPQDAPPSGATSPPAPAAPSAIFLFGSAHYAMWAEDVTREAGVEGKVIPAPPSDGATCGLAMEVPAERADSLEESFRAEGIEFRRLPK